MQGRWIAAGVVLTAAAMAFGVLFAQPDEAVLARHHPVAPTSGEPAPPDAGRLSAPPSRVVTARDAQGVTIRGDADPQAALREDLRRESFSLEWLVARGFASASALQRLHDLLDARAELSPAPRARMAVMPSGAPGDGAPERARLSAAERYVVATLRAEDAGGADTVLVRWRRVGDDRVMELAAHPAAVAPGGAQEIWMYRPRGWEPGAYRLEVISADARLAPLAAGEFEIVAEGQQVDAFAYPASRPGP